MAENGKRIYRMVTVIAEMKSMDDFAALLKVDPDDEGIIAYFGATESAESFPSAFIGLRRQMEDRWIALSEMAHMVEATTTEVADASLLDEKTDG